MDIAATLVALLSAGATLAAQGALGEFAKSGGKAAFDALKARLAGTHRVDGLDMLAKPAFAAGIRSELEKPAIAADPEVLRLADTLRRAIEALPREAQAAVDVETIRAGRDVLIRAVDGLRARTIDAGQDAVIENVRSPGKS